MCDATVVVIDTDTNKMVATIPVGLKFRGLAFNNQGQCVKYVNRHAH